MKNFIASIVCGLVAATSLVAAPWRPTEPVKIIVGYSPGGGADFSARVVADKMAEYLGQPVIVENKPGAGASIAMMAVKNSEPNGLTLGVGTPTPLGTNFLFAKPEYTIDDFVAVAGIYESPWLLITQSSLPLTTYADMVAYVRQNPGKLSHGGTINGNDSIRMSIIKRQEKIDVGFVSYKGGALAKADFLGGHVHFLTDIVASLKSVVEEGKGRVLVVGYHKRLDQYPGIPTVLELGINDIADAQWYNLVVPKNTPDHIVQELNRAVNFALQDPSVRQKLETGSAIPLGGTVAESNQYMKNSHALKINIGKKLKLGNFAEK
jgi:tripartite-type tricarboxylate transporter receptor subunit TctC